MDNVRIAIRDSTDSHNIAFFDNISGIRYQSANLQRFLAGSASILTIEYNSKDIDTIRTGCKLAFIYKQRAYWLNIMDLSKKGYKVEITAYSLGLELNQEERGAHKPANAMSFNEYLAYYDPEHALEIGVNEVADKRIKLEWTGTDTILARLFSIANSFDAELEFTVELNQDYSLKRQVLNIYKKGNLGSNRAASPIRVGRGLKVINYSDNLKELRTAVRATGKDGLTIDGLNKKVYDDDGNLLYYSSGMTVYAPQSRDKYPSVGKKSNDNWIIKDLGETEYSTKEALWSYMLGELKKICVPEITYDIEGTVDGDVGDTRTLIDDVHYDPPLYVQGRISELTEDLITGKVTKSTLTNFERKYSQVASELLKQVEQLANDAAPYIVRLSTDNGYNFKNGKGSSTVTAKLEKYGKIVNANWKWLINNSIVSDKNSVTINASQVAGTLNVVAVATVDGNEAAREYITFTNSDDGVGIKSIKRYYTTNDQAEGVTAGGQNWSTKPATVTADKNYMWSYDVITYTNDTSLVTEPAVIGARGDDGLDADTTGITEALDKAKQELSALSANIEKVRDDSLAAVNEAKQQLTTVANELNTAKQDLQTQASQLQAQANAQSELTKRVSSVEETANGTKTTVSELSKTVAQNGKDITSVTARTKTVEDDLTSTKTTLSQVKTTADSTSQKTATLETGLNGVKADLTATTATANTIKTNLANYQASNDKAVANLQSNLQTANGNISSLQTKVEAVPGQITSAVSAVEGKIPTEIGGRNLYALSKNSPIWFNEISNLAQNIATGEISFKVTGRDPFFGTQADKNVAFGYRGVKIPVKTGQDIAVQLTNELFTKNFVSYFGDDDKAVKNFKAYQTNKFVIPASELEGVSYVAFRFGIKEDTQEVGSVHSTKVKVEYGNVYTDWSPAPEDTASQIGSLSSQIQQTADGMTLLATKTELNSAKSELQSGISTATSKADSAQATANSNAQTISTHTTQISALNTGLSAKVSQTDFNTLSGRVTTAENNITAKANELSSKITSVEGKIPTSVGGTNLLLYSADPWKAPNDYYQSIGAVKTDETLNGSIVYKTHTAWTSLRSNWGKQLIDRKNVKVGDEFTYSIYAKTDQSSMKVCLVARFSEAGETAALSDVISLTNEWQKLSVTFKVTQKMVASQSKLNWVGFEQVTNSEDGKFVYYACNKLERGNIATDYSPNPEDYDSKLATAQSEIKQTTDSISASVSSVQVTASNAQSTANTAVSKADAAQAGVNTLDSTTVKTASLTINTDGIVMKAGKSTTDVANAIGSYFAVNQNAINLFADKIKVKGDMIVDGSITADKFKGNQITSLNGATTLNLYTGEIIFNNQYATINQIKGSYKSQISLFSLDNGAVNESAWSSVNTLAFNSTKLTSATRRAGSAVDMFPNFSLMTLYGEKIAFTGETSGAPGPQNAIIVNTNSDEVNFTNSQTNSSKGAWNYSMIMNFGANAAISAPDIKLAGHFKSLTGILDDLCKKVGIMWI
ncbi:Chromosome partition protein Smc [Streptococcus infantarius subsp. infantarius]|nr:Chromosome partition protein Smc [Streptococcus infantarius subsp. infantarius]